MSKFAAYRSGKHLHPSDLRAAAQLTTQAVLGASQIAEELHQTFWSTLGFRGGEQPGQARGITGMFYRTFNELTRMVGSGVDSVLTLIEPDLPCEDGSPQRESVIAALNGVMGDKLAATNNPLATRMSIRYEGQAIDWRSPPDPDVASSKVLLLIHGLCMSELQWHTGYHDGANDYGSVLAKTRGYTPLYLRYNSGLHISDNGWELANQLETLHDYWATPVQEISVLAHSMGGLLIRSAVYQAQQAGMHWPERLKNIVFLGTPHHGAPLEQAGNWLEGILRKLPYAAPFANLGQVRSAGITDLRHGHVLAEDWHGQDRYQRIPDQRRHLPLPEGVACHTIAATTAPRRNDLMARLLGDGLVLLPSALGQHTDPSRSLSFAEEAQWIACRMNHMALLNHPRVLRKLLRWLPAH
ncbi:esterase/lipase family protein [Parachitinimonas caeni]|uniref:Alpha/beta hydrolase n=1 Tax=Parachitinimonas caeni TaxID=3031301 RepID=A0ABT7DXF0_9NEIS|nr:alpha/beta fold hydrolase [Parachitinimonas caeni]MDK2124746.1 alpha/beta hydrolase [Parachitinimonas caeni]